MTAPGKASLPLPPHKAEGPISRGSLVGLLDTEDGRLKQLAARDILDQHVRFRELDDLTHRIEAIEDPRKDAT